MAKGKFEAGRRPAKAAGRTDPYAVRNKPAAKQADKARLWPILAAVAGVAVLVVGILIFSKWSANHANGSATTEAPLSTVALEGMPRAELEKRFSELNEVLRGDVTLTLNPNPAEAGHSEEPLVLTLAQADTGVGLDLDKLKADLDAGVGLERGDSFLLDPRDYLTWNDEALHSALDAFAAEYGTSYEDASAKLTKAEPSDANAEGTLPEKVLLVRTGVTGRGFTAEELYETVRDAWQLALVAEEPEEALKPTRSYELRIPEQPDVEKLYESYCQDAVEPQLEKTTGEVKEGADGYGFDRDALTAALTDAAEGTELRVPIFVTHPELTAEDLRESLFKDVLAEAHTEYTNIPNRTNNLKLACAAIDGTILMPGEVFSFNSVVGERTEAKGYLPAIAYVSGGLSSPEIGGGICQVASSIYYAVLRADLKTTERTPHMFKVDYVPGGQDATIYWGNHDYKFENNSPYPVKIQASVRVSSKKSERTVDIVLLGTEWKDYTVEITSEKLEEFSYKTVEKEVPNDGTYKNGDVITSPYNGYRFAVYRTTKDRVTGQEIETTKIGETRYNKRDRVIAKVTNSSGSGGSSGSSHSSSSTTKESTTSSEQASSSSEEVTTTTAAAPEPTTTAAAPPEPTPSEHEPEPSEEDPSVDPTPSGDENEP